MYEQLAQHVCDTLERQHVAADKTALNMWALGLQEDLGDYANALRVLTRRAYGHVYRPAQVEEHAGEQFVRGLTGPLKQRVHKEFKDYLDSSLQLARNLKTVGVSRVAAVGAPVAPSVLRPRAAVGARSWNGRNRRQTGNHGGGVQGSQGSRPSGGSSQGASSGSQGARPKTDLTC
jgi:uncharacterized membrane protein YgcG